MAIFITSQVETCYMDENGNRIAIKLKNKNNFLTNLKKFCLKLIKIVAVANNPDDTDKNDAKAKAVFDSFKLTGFDFKEQVVLDNRNAQNAETILKDADLVILSGGKCLCQLNFFKRIKLKNLIKKYNLLTIGNSSGSMNLCKTVANFPEEECDLSEPRWLKGLGLFNEIIMPHFDGKKYQFEIEIDLVNDYILPFSKGRRFIAIPNGSYIVVDGKKVEYFGKFYEISDGKIVEMKNCKK